MIKNVIFDFGGVLLNLDFNRTFRAFEDLGFADFEKQFSQYTADPLFRKIEKGLITPGEFYDGLRMLLKKIFPIMTWNLPGTRCCWITVSIALIF